MAANATRFCFLTVRTKPLRVRFPPDGRACGGVGLKSEAIVVGELDELHRRHVASADGGTGARREGDSSSGRRETRRGWHGVLGMGASGNDKRSRGSERQAVRCSGLMDRPGEDLEDGDVFKSLRLRVRHLASWPVLLVSEGMGPAAQVPPQRILYVVPQYCHQRLSQCPGQVYTASVLLSGTTYRIYS